MNRHLIPIFFFVLLSALSTSAFSPKIDPIKFTLSTSATQVGLNEEFEIVIIAEYLNVSPNFAFVLKDANSFRLKLTVPDGFVKTGGDYYDYVGAELTRSKPKVFFKLKGKFTSQNGSATFELLRSHKNADNQSTFVAAGRLTFNLESNGTEVSGQPDARIASGAPGFVPYMTIAQLRSGFADTATVVTITDVFRAGIFRYDPADSSTGDDGSLVLIGNNKRYKRVFSGPANAKWFGIIADGSDESTKWQSMLDNTNVNSFYFEKTANPYRINFVELKRDDLTIIFESGADVFGLGNSLRPDKITMFTIKNRSNIAIRGKAIIRDMKETYPTGEDGQYQGCIKVLGSENLSIEDITIKNVGGDGIYLGSGAGGKTNINTKITNVTIDNFARNGVSIITGNGVWITNCNFKNGGGVAPGNGIDIEPNASWEVVKGVKITNLYTQNNLGGILIALAHHANSAQVADIVVDNHTDEGSIIGCTIAQTEGNFRGSIVIKNSTWRDNFKAGFLAYNYAASGPRVDIYNPVVINAASGSISLYGYNAAYMFFREADEVGEALLGNIHFHEPSVLDTRSPYASIIGFLFADGSNALQTSKWTNCSILNPKAFQIFAPWGQVVSLSSASFPLITDKYGVMIKDIGNINTTIRSNYGSIISESVGYYRTVNNTTSTALQTVTLHDAIANGAEVTVEVTAAQTLRVTPLSSWSLRPIGSAGASLQSDVIGSKLTLIKEDATLSWKIKEVQGTWTNTFGDVLFGPQPASVVNTATSVPTKTSLNASYGFTRAGTIVSYTLITGGGRHYRKLLDSATSDWVETIWATGVSSKLP